MRFTFALTILFHLASASYAKTPCHALKFLAGSSEDIRSAYTSLIQKIPTDVLRKMSETEDLFLEASFAVASDLSPIMNAFQQIRSVCKDRKSLKDALIAELNARDLDIEQQQRLNRRLSQGLVNPRLVFKRTLGNELDRLVFSHDGASLLAKQSNLMWGKFEWLFVDLKKNKIKASPQRGDLFYFGTEATPYQTRFEGSLSRHSNIYRIFKKKNPELAEDLASFGVPYLDFRNRILAAAAAPADTSHKRLWNFWNLDTKRSMGKIRLRRWSDDMAIAGEFAVGLTGYSSSDGPGARWTKLEFEIVHLKGADISSVSVTAKIKRSVLKPNEVRSIDISRDASLIAIIVGGGIAVLKRPQSGWAKRIIPFEFLEKFPARPIGLRILNGGEYLLVVCSNGSLYLYDTVAFDEVAFKKLGISAEEQIGAMELSPDLKTLALIGSTKTPPSRSHRKDHWDHQVRIYSVNELFGLDFEK